MFRSRATPPETESNRDSKGQMEDSIVPDVGNQNPTKQKQPLVAADLTIHEQTEESNPDLSGTEALWV